MPELPEVQTVVSTLEGLIKNRRIIDVEVRYERIIQCDVSEFKNRLIGQHFKNFKRRGKYLLFELDDCCMVSHLRMEGKYFVESSNNTIEKHTHVIFKLDNGQDLRYNDVRKFGTMELIPLDSKYPSLHNLGVEPLSEDFNAEYCYKNSKNLKRNLKQQLMDQTFVAGIGNIYADEICFRSKIHPATSCLKISKKMWGNIVDNTKEILNNAISQGGTTIRSYTSSLGVSGKFQVNLDVYGKEGKPCPSCKTTIKKIKLNQRGTSFCPKCQKEY